MTLDRSSKTGILRRLAVTAAAVAAMVAGPVAAQVTTHFDIVGTPTTSTTIAQGGSVTFDVLIDAPSVATIGASFTLTQTAGTSGFFSITGRSFAGSIYNDAASGQPDSAVLASPGNLLDPTNNVNLGRSTVGLVGAATGNNLQVVQLTVTASGSTPLGTYTIQPTPGVSVVTGPGPSFTDYSMSAAFINVTVGATLTVTKNGTGTGTVTSNVPGINCGSDCSEVYAGDVVTLTATPNPGSTFAGWSGGGCSGTGTCVVTVDAAKTVTATFTVIPTFTLSVVKTGNGTGTVTSTPAGINCGATCSAGYISGTVVTLTATPGPGQTFAGWSGGGCSGTGSCVVTITAATAVTATFTDTIAPDTFINSGPSSPSSDATPTFTFSSDDAGATFQCSLDGAAYVPCSSPYTVTVANGSHVLLVRAVDQAGNVDPTPASYAWTAAGIVAAAALPVPTLSETMLMALMLMMAGLGIALQRKRR